MQKKHSFAQEQRFRFIEATLLWEGEVQRRRVCEVFGIAANHVTIDFKVYQDEYPDSILFNPRLRAYVPGEKFRPAFASGSSSEYLSILQAYVESGSPKALSAYAANIPIDALPSPVHRIQEDILRTAIQAIRNYHGMDVIYNSMSSGKPQKRIFWPHSLMFTGFKWFLRAFDSIREDFCDFALQRIATAKTITISSPRDKIDDDKWHQHETIEVVPSPDLNEHQKKIVSQEYGMKKEGDEYIWRVEIRQSLIRYFANRFGLDEGYPLDTSRSRIVLKNRDQVSKFFNKA